MEKTYVTFEEFTNFKTMIEEKLFKTYKKPFELADLMMSGFDRIDQKIDKKIDDLRESTALRFDDLKSDLSLIKKHLGV